MSELDREIFGDFTFYPPTDEHSSWGISHGGLWLPVMLADRAACKAVALLFPETLTDEHILALQATYTRANPMVPVTREHILTMLKMEHS